MAHLAALGGAALPGRGRQPERPATSAGARVSRPESRQFLRLWPSRHEPEVNMREPMLPRWLKRHRHQMPNGVPWVSGALLAPGVAMTNGTWGPRAFW
eukprot:scaffold79693_cov46-Phaeocystis_antarctica.AAC.3